MISLEGAMLKATVAACQNPMDSVNFEEQRKQSCHYVFMTAGMASISEDAGTKYAKTCSERIGVLTADVKHSRSKDTPCGGARITETVIWCMSHNAPIV